MKSIVMERRSRFFGALAGVGLLFGVPEYRAQKQKEPVEEGARVVLDAALAGEVQSLSFDRAQSRVIDLLHLNHVRLGPMKSYEIRDVRCHPDGTADVSGEVKREGKAFFFTMKTNAQGWPYRYSEED